MADISIPWGDDPAADGKQAGTLTVSLPADWTVQQVAAPVIPSADDDWPERLAAALVRPEGTPPLEKLLAARHGARVVVIVEDLTRHSPLPIILEAVFREFHHANVPDENIEIFFATGMHPPMTPEEAAAKIGMILRSVEGMKRGIGTIRQDVNISIQGQAKVEIKGFQDYKSIAKVIDDEIKRQLELLKKGKPITSEVRNAKPDFTTEFLRPNPGADRMYPETDVPIIKVDLSGIRAGKTLEEKEKELMLEYSLTPELAKELLRKKIDIRLFVNKYKSIKPSFIAETLIITPKEIKARFKLDINPLLHIDEILRRVDKGEIDKKAMLEILVQIAKGEKVDYSQYVLADESTLKEDIEKIIGKNPGASIGALMGMVMDKHRGKVDGKKVMELIKELTGK